MENRETPAAEDLRYLTTELMRLTTPAGRCGWYYNPAMDFYGDRIIVTAHLGLEWLAHWLHTRITANTVHGLAELDGQYVEAFVAALALLRVQRIPSEQQLPELLKGLEGQIGALAVAAHEAARELENDQQ